MREKPVSCPICGAEVRLVGTRENSYYKCSNESCYFRVGLNYTDEEIALQGKKLKSVCLQCGAPLGIACGPHGLYPRCFECNCDSKPMTIGGLVVNKWANAHSWNAKEEIKKLLKEFKKQNELDYGFEEIHENELPKKEVIKKEVCKDKSYKVSYDGIPQKILNLLSTHSNKSFDASTMSETLNISLFSTRKALTSLKNKGLIKVVSCKTGGKGTMTQYYRLSSSPMPELKIYEEDEGYITVNDFRDVLQKDFNITISGNALRAKIDINKLRMYPMQKAKGIFSSYKKAELLGMFNLSSNNDNNKKSVSTRKKDLKNLSSEHLPLEELIKEKLREDLTKKFTVKGLSAETKRNLDSVRGCVRKLLRRKKLKIVGWDYENYSFKGAVSLLYQLKESPLPKFDTVKDNVNYLTIHQFYNKKMKGLRKVSLHQIVKLVEKYNLSAAPLIINKKAYIGYSTKDLNDMFSLLVGDNVERAKKNIKNKVAKRKALVKAGSSNKLTSHKKEGTKKPFGFLNTFFSFFNKSQS